MSKDEQLLPGAIDGSIAVSGGCHVPYRMNNDIQVEIAITFARAQVNRCSESL